MSITIPSPLAVAANRKARIERPEPMLRLAYSSTTGVTRSPSRRDRIAAHRAFFEIQCINGLHAGPPLDGEAADRVSALWRIVDRYEADGGATIRMALRPIVETDAWMDDCYLEDGGLFYTED